MTAYTLDPQVAIRPEPFGALAYHYGNRRLTFLRDPALVEIVRDVDRHASVDDALAASGIERGRWPSFRHALATLADSGILHVR